MLNYVVNLPDDPDGTMPKLTRNQWPEVVPWAPNLWRIKPMDLAMALSQEASLARTSLLPKPAKFPSFSGQITVNTRNPAPILAFMAL